MGVALDGSGLVDSGRAGGDEGGDEGGSRLVGLRLLKNESRGALRGDAGALQRGGVQGLE